MSQTRRTRGPVSESRNYYLHLQKVSGKEAIGTLGYIYRLFPLIALNST